MKTTATAAIAAIALASTQAAAQEPFAAAELTTDGRILSSATEGVAPGALFQAGSIAKYACSILALRLQDRGQLDLDAPLAELLPQLELGDAGKPTFRQVLANRSGLRDRLMPAVKDDLQAVLATGSADAAVQRFVAGDLAREPDSKFSYDLVNWITVQAVLERVSGEPLAILMRRLILDPAGMGATDVFEGQIGAGAQQPAEPAMPMPGFLQCAGGLATVPGDLIALMRFAHKGGLSNAALEELMSVHTPEENYALGGRVRQTPLGTIGWETGSNGPYKSVAVYDPVRDAGFAAMTATGEWTAINAARDAWIEKLGDE